MRKDFFPRHDFERALQNAIGARIAITNRVAQQFVAAREQCEINAPGIDRDARDPIAVFRLGRMQTVLHVLPKLQQVPIQSAPQRRRTVFESVKLLDGKSGPVEQPGQMATAGSSQIDGDVTGGWHVGVVSWVGK